MWKRDQETKPTNRSSTPPAAVPTPPIATAPIRLTETPIESGITPLPPPMGRSETGSMVHIGKSVVVKGELQGSEDLMIEGQVEAKIELKDNVLTIGPHGRIKGQVFAKTVVVLGTVNGNLTASEKVDIRDGATVDGDVVSPRVAIAEGAQFHGSVDMKPRDTKRLQQDAAATNATAKPANGAAPVGDVQPRAAAPTH